MADSTLTADALLAAARAHYRPANDDPPFEYLGADEQQGWVEEIRPAVVAALTAAGLLRTSDDGYRSPNRDTCTPGCAYPCTGAPYHGKAW